MFDQGRPICVGYNYVGMQRSITTGWYVQTTYNDGRPHVTSLTVVCTSWMIGKAHMRCRTTFLCRQNAMLEGHIQCRLSILFSKKSMPECYIWHWLIILKRTNATREGHAWRRMTVVRAKGDRGRKHPTSIDRCVGQIQWGHETLNVSWTLFTSHERYSQSMLNDD